jgi:hypothetical protein
MVRTINILRTLRSAGIRVLRLYRTERKVIDTRQALQRGGAAARHTGRYV